MPNYYATTTTLDTRMVGITFDTATTSLGQECIYDAESEVNKYLSNRYDLSGYQTATSFSTLPPLIKSLTLKLSQGYMWMYGSRGGKESLARGKSLVKDVLENLKLIADSKLNLLDPDGDPISESATLSSVLSNTDGYHSTFDEDDPLSWSVDSNKLKDIASDRDV